MTMIFYDHDCTSCHVIHWAPETLTFMPFKHTTTTQQNEEHTLLQAVTYLPEINQSQAWQLPALGHGKRITG